MTAQGLDLVLCWHMHQPEYRDLESGEFALPWVYLHAIKDYADMAAHAEQHPGLRMVFNFVPVLLEQLGDYARQFAEKEWRDPVLRWLVCEDFCALTLAERRQILATCFRVNHETMLQPFEGYRRLRAWAEPLREADDIDLAYVSSQYFADAVTWYHLSWTGETVRRAHPELLALMRRGNTFSLGERRRLSEVLGEVVQSIIPRYGRLAERGQIELSTTPYYHPITPLLLDFASARESLPEVDLPQRRIYEGGHARARQHLQLALQAHERWFGSPAQGVWPAEGGVSLAAAQLFAEQGVKWIATGEGVLANSLKADRQFAGGRESYLYTPYGVDGAAGHAIACFFRDDKLSDRIGFEYAKWHADDAVPDFVGALEHIAQSAADGVRPLVSIILDGENAWEYYPFNAYYFLDQLYTALEHHDFIKTVTPSAWLQTGARATAMPRLQVLCAGSWVYGTFSTWIGSPAKNRAWELLCDAKLVFDAVCPRLDGATQARAQRQLSVCEGSDWFWWFGDYNPTDSVASFDRLFRDNLRRLYVLLGTSAPAALDEPISTGGGAQEAGGVMRRSA